MLFDYYYSQEHAGNTRRTMNSNIDYTHVVVHGCSDEEFNREVPADAVLVAIENVTGLTIKQEK